MSNKHTPITNLFDDDSEVPQEIYYNGLPNYWHDMPEFIQESNEGVDAIAIIFESDEEIDEFGREILGVEEFWGDRLWLTKGIWWPPKDRKRNSNLRFVHRSTAEAHPDLYKIVDIDEIDP